MKKLTALLCAILSTTIALAQIPDTTLVKIKKLGNEYAAQKGNKSLVIGVYFKGNEKLFYFGSTENKTTDSTSLFEIGSITKVFTTALFVEMAMKGEIKEDEPLENFLPNNVLVPVYQNIICQPVEDKISPTQNNTSDPIKFTPYMCYPDPKDHPSKILLCDLATHTSGLPRMPKNFPLLKSNPYKTYTKEKMYDDLSSLKVSKEKYLEFNYSNYGMALLGHALSLKSGIEYDELLKRKILNPLKLYATTTEVNIEQRFRLLPGHTSKGKLSGTTDFDVMAPCGALKSNLTDMMHFLKINMGIEQSELKNVFDKCHNPRLIVNNKQFKNTEIGYGWIISPIINSGLKITWHNGGTAGFRSFIGFIETKYIGVVGLSNSANNIDYLCVEILKLLNEY